MQISIIICLKYIFVKDFKLFEEHLLMTQGI